MVAVTFDSVKELLAKTEQERRDELVHNDVKLKELQAICHVLGLLCFFCCLFTQRKRTQAISVKNTLTSLYVN